MKLAEALRILRSVDSLLRERFGVKKIGVFGSVARDTAREDSDVDLVVEMPPDLFAMVHLKEFLENELQAKVDLVRYRNDLNSFLKNRIEAEVINV